MPNIGPLELAIVLVIVLIIFGPKKLPGLGRQLGTGMREFKDSITGNSSHDDDDEQDALGRPELRRAETTGTPESSATSPSRDDAPVSGS